MDTIQYPAEVRQELLYLLRRIENGIEVENNIQGLWQLCGQQKIDADYLLQFIGSALVKSKDVLDALAKNAGT